MCVTQRKIIKLKMIRWMTCSLKNCSREQAQVMRFEIVLSNNKIICGDQCHTQFELFGFQTSQNLSLLQTFAERIYLGVWNM